MATKTSKASNRYLVLIEQLPLRPIRSERELDRAIAMVDALSDRDTLAPEENDYLLVLTTLIEEFEEAHYPMPPVSGAQMLRYLIEARGVTQAEVAAEVRIAESALSEILAGKRGLSAKYMSALGRYFHVDPGVFISD